MGLWGGLKGIGRGVGRWAGEEVARLAAPVVSAVEGDWKGALSDTARLGKRFTQGAALFGKEKIGGIGVGALGAATGAIEGGLGPSRASEELYGDKRLPAGTERADLLGVLPGTYPSSGWAGALGGAAKGYAGVQATKALHQLGGELGINKQLAQYNPFTMGGQDLGPTREEKLKQLMIRPGYEGLTADEVADAEYQRGGQLIARGELERPWTGTSTTEMVPRGPGVPATSSRTAPVGRGINMPGVTRQEPANQQLQQTFSGTRTGPLSDWELEGQKIIRQAGDQDERTLRLRSQGTPLVPEGKRRFNFYGSGGPGGSPEQQAAIEEARFRVSYPDDPDPIRTPGFYSPETPPSERTPLSFAAPQIPEDPGMGGVSALSRPGLPAPSPYTPQRPGPALRPPSGASNIGRGTASASQRDAVQDRMRSQVDRMRAASGGGGVDPGMRAAADDLGAEFDQRIAAAREQYGPGGFNVVRQLTPAEQAEAMVGVNRRQALLRGEDPGPTSSDTLSPGRLGAPQAISAPSAGRGFQEMSPGGVPATSSRTAPVGREINMPSVTLQAPANIGRNVQGGGDPNRPWWRKGLDYVGENIDADTLVNAAGQLMQGGGQDEYYRRQAITNERMMDLREQQAAYDQDRERLREQMLLRGSQSRWA
jgi:hypothetical protein